MNNKEELPRTHGSMSMVQSKVCYTIINNYLLLCTPYHTYQPHFFPKTAEEREANDNDEEIKRYIVLLPR